MNLQGSKPYAVPRFDGKVDFDYKTAYPMGIGIVVKNCRFLMQSVATRYGLKATMSNGASRVTGLNILNFIGGANQDIPTRFDYAGVFTKESPAGSGTMVAVTSALLTLPASSYQQSTIAYNREWTGYSDLFTATGPNALFDGATGNLDPISMRPIGTPFEVGGKYIVGEIICPTVSNSHTYRVSTGGTAAGEPVWPTTDGGTVSSGAVTFTEITPIATTTLRVPDGPILTRSAGAGTFPAGRDVYIRTTFVSPQGETDIVTQDAATIINTVLNDRVIVTSPTVPAWVSVLDVSYVPTQYKVYEADVAHGADPPADSAYLLSATTTLGSPTNVNAAAIGVAGPTGNDAWVTPEGNVCAGVRYMSVLFETQTDYITGFSAGAVIAVDVQTPGRQLLVTNLYTGPGNIAARDCIFTVPGTTANPQTPAGYYFFIPEDDNVQGIGITATRVANNSVASAVFDFYDAYLAESEDVSDFYLKMKVPNCVDVYYSVALDRMIYTGATGYESGHLVSERADPETVLGGSGIVQVAENNGQRCVCYREMISGEQLSFKDGSVYNIQPADSTTPATWASIPRWDKAGACGPRAVDIAGTLCVFAHETGVWKYEASNFMPISDEIKNSWAGINWTYKHLIWVHIDTLAKEIRIGVPYGTSTVCDKVFTLNYLMGWDPPVVINMFGKLTASHNARKWSGPDDLPATMAMTATRTLSVSVNPVINNRQILLASSLADGRVNMIVPDQYNDNGAAIDCQYQPSFAQEANGATLSFTGMIAAARGLGKMIYRAVTNKASDILPTREQVLSNPDSVDFDDGVRGEGKYFSYLFTNGNKANAWFELTQLIMYARPKWLGRP